MSSVRRIDSVSTFQLIIFYTLRCFCGKPAVQTLCTLFINSYNAVNITYVTIRWLLSDKSVLHQFLCDFQDLL